MKIVEFTAEEIAANKLKAKEAAEAPIKLRELVSRSRRERKIKHVELGQHEVDALKDCKEFTWDATAKTGTFGDLPIKTL